MELQVMILDDEILFWMACVLFPGLIMDIR